MNIARDWVINGHGAAKDGFHKLVGHQIAVLHLAVVLITFLGTCDSAPNQMSSATLAALKDGRINLQERKIRDQKVKMLSDGVYSQPIPHQHLMLKNGGWQLKHGKIQHQLHLSEIHMAQNGLLDVIQIAMGT